MIYPKFLKEGNTIGIFAPSAGVGKKIDEMDESVAVLKNEGYKIFETVSVRINSKRSASATKRNREFEELLLNRDIDMILMATGGDYMIEMMPYVDFEKIRENPKWMMGYSDPTNLLFTTTTLCDIATLYGYNGCSYVENADKSQNINLKFLKGELVKQDSYKKYQSFIDIINDTGIEKDVEWVCKTDTEFKGRCIGGCFESIEKLIGTPLDAVKDYIERYKEDGIVWYFDVFSDNSYQFYLTLLQMKMAGYFKYCNGVIFGRVAFPNIEDPQMDYHKAADKVLGRIPHIMEADIGHTHPRMTMINGAIIEVECKNKKGSIKFVLK